MQRQVSILLLSILLLFGGKISAQDPHFSQFFANPIYLNPAFAGTNVCPRIALNFRDQWPSLPGTYMTYSASYDQHFDVLNGGIGVLFFGDRAGQGTINTYSAHFMYSFRIKMSSKFEMRLALQAGWQQKSLAWDKLIFPDQIDPRYGGVFMTNEKTPEKLSSNIFDLGAGLVGYSEHIYFGFAAHHITNPNEGFVNEVVTRLPVRWTGHFGAYIDLKRKSKKERSFGDISISPNIIYQMQSSAYYLNTGFYLNFYPFTVGVWLRNNFVKGDPMDAVIVMVGLQYDFIRVAYSYDISLGKLANISGGAHEASVQFLLPCPEKIKRIKNLKCPSF
ncbi:MAG: PorP/SprF family type IX secretion system membrane protein [Bacteroidales bacterium]|jgi:type IX secretion system PorP/SprF family membrane protein|nr:PorP/SprF family type IX secretion system membrane protein [Bacteroidales bacterium]